MISVDAVKGMIQDRVNGGDAPHAAYEHVLAMLDQHVVEIGAERDARRQKLQTAGIPADLIEESLDGYRIQIDIALTMKQFALVLRDANWTPPPG
jgi:hypothetical protein